MTLMTQFLAEPCATDEMLFCHLGQHGFLFRFDDTAIGCDLFLSPLPDRMVPPLVSAEDLKSVGLLTGSHDHADHIDRPLWRSLTEAEFVLPKAVSADIEPVRLHGLNAGESFTYKNVTITAVPSAHELLDRDPMGLYPYLGYIFEGNGVRIYHAGDCCIYPELFATLKAYRFDALFLPINGRDARRLKANCIGNMTYQEAADLAGYLQPRAVVPAHYDMFAMNQEDPQLFLDYMQVKYPAITVILPQTGHIQKISRQEKSA